MRSQKSSRKLPARTLFLEAVRRLDAAGTTVTIAALAKAMGLSRATMYRIVPNRAALQELLGNATVRTPQEDRIASIFRAVRIVLERRGIGALTMEEVAREAGVATATLYRRYENREGLLRAFLDAMPTRKTARAMEAGPVTSVEADLSLLAAAALRGLEENRALLVGVLGAPRETREWMEKLNDSSRGTTAALTRYFAKCTKLGLLDAPDPEAAARAFGSLLFGLGLRPALEGSAPPDPESTARFVARLFLNGLAPRRSPLRRS